MKSLALVSGMMFAAASGMTQAATQERDTPQHQVAMPTAASPAKHGGVGVIKAVNAGKVQIAHEAIADLEWPAMTMWFALQNPLPTNMKVGDSVLFELEQNPSNKWVIIRIEPKR